MTTFTGQQVDASSPQRTSAAWDESPLRTKLTLLITAAMGVGVAFGALAVTEYASWLLVAAAAGVLLFILIPFSHAWVAGPFDRLIRRMEQLARHAASADLKMLPVERRDEIGRVARAARELGHTLRRYDLEARTLRRDMNNRVEQATRAAREGHRTAPMMTRELAAGSSATPSGHGTTGRAADEGRGGPAPQDIRPRRLRSGPTGTRGEYPARRR